MWNLSILVETVDKTSNISLTYQPPIAKRGQLQFIRTQWKTLRCCWLFFVLYTTLPNSWSNSYPETHIYLSRSACGSFSIIFLFTSLKHYFPTQLLVGKQLRSTIPVTMTSLQPEIPELTNFKQADHDIQERQRLIKTLSKRRYGILIRRSGLPI